VEVSFSNLAFATKGKQGSHTSNGRPQVFQTFKWMLASDQQCKVSGWVKKAVAATFTGKSQAEHESMAAASSSSSSKAQKAKKEADSASVMHLFGN
jgi:hypothetical protein